MNKAFTYLNAEFKIEEKGEPSKYMEIEISQQSDGSINLSQPFLTEWILDIIPSIKEANKDPTPTTKTLLNKDEE